MVIHYVHCRYSMYSSCKTTCIVSILHTLTKCTYQYYKQHRNYKNKQEIVTCGQPASVEVKDRKYTHSHKDLLVIIMSLTLNIHPDMAACDNTAVIQFRYHIGFQGQIHAFTKDHLYGTFEY